MNRLLCWLGWHAWHYYQGVVPCIVNYEWVETARRCRRRGCPEHSRLTFFDSYRKDIEPDSLSWRERPRNESAHLRAILRDLA